jgi:hypothetical protein
VGTQSLLAEILLSGFFAIACFQARAESPGVQGLALGKSFALTGRLEHLRRSRWPWSCMVLLLVLIRVQIGTPLVAELTRREEVDRVFNERSSRGSVIQSLADTDGGRR